jgi:hypothetical protein
MSCSKPLSGLFRVFLEGAESRDGKVALAVAYPCDHQRRGDGRAHAQPGNDGYRLEKPRERRLDD